VENADYDVKHIKLLLEELISGSSGALRPVIPYDLRLELMPQIETSLSQDGYDRNIITLHFNEPSETYDQQFVCAAITLTVTGFYPEVEGVKIFFGDTEAQYAGVGAKMFRRSDFTQLIGNTVYIDVPDTSENVFKSTHVSLPYGDTYLPKVRLDKLFEILPEAYAAFTSADIKDIYVYDDTAVIDMTTGFAAKLRELPAPDGGGDIDYIESLLIYSIVNTVTELDGINKVWFLENGERILDGASLYLGNALLRSPGNIVSE
jgi:hypothetical protein